MCPRSCLPWPRTADASGPQVTVVKALASAICIGTGGSVGREGPIVQIGSAFASTLGQLVRMSETRLRIIVACGAAGGIAATFNAPLTGVFFGFEIILRDFSIDALFGTILSAVAADLVSRAVFGSAPFFSNLPHNLVVHDDRTFLLMAVLGVTSGLLGWGFKTFLYRLEDIGDALWKQRPEWARPAVGGIALGALLLLIPQMYGVGYPVMAKAVAGHYVLWFVIVLLFAKILATSLTLSIGGSGGVFAPSLFIGAMEGMAFGSIVAAPLRSRREHPRRVRRGGDGRCVRCGGASPSDRHRQRPGDDRELHPHGSGHARGRDCRCCLEASQLRQHLHHEAVAPGHRHRASAPDECLAHLDGRRRHAASRDGCRGLRPRGFPGRTASRRATTAGPPCSASATDLGPPQVLFADETLDQALRQLVLYGRFGLPVLSPDEKYLRGWITRRNVLHAVSERMGSATREAELGTLAAEFSEPDAAARLHKPPKPLQGYDLFEIPIRASSPIVGSALSPRWRGHVGSVVVAVSENHELVAPRTDALLLAGERIVLLAPVAEAGPSGATLDEGPRPDQDADGGELDQPE